MDPRAARKEVIVSRFARDRIVTPFSDSQRINLHRFVRMGKHDLFRNRDLSVKTEKLMSQRRYCKNPRRNLLPRFCTTASTIYRRKLLGHERDSYRRPARRRESRRTHWRVIATRKSRLRESKRNAIAEDNGDEDTGSETWDSWNNWSACSVTCGQGRQVRWRHCLSENCAKGLKKAQMKSCRLEDCGKGLLSWLGIKS